MAAMLREDTYGYKLIRDISPYIELSESTLYPILKRLEAAGNVSVYTTEHNGRLRKYYSISASGRQKIAEFLEGWGSIMKLYEFIKEDYQNDKE